ncbi:NAD(P)/FAD-dependent oxidoreductase [Nocardioides sp. LS1]|uniref:NAD(P)/FAD-dependent oxidoreductase n=1 Tax=Nocardioides sp. LS1 TaxID=1027620 RepID=UPI0021AB37AE|nr:FAD-dependent oxidoreductase [Nocardioides sp. LS1]
MQTRLPGRVVIVGASQAGLAAAETLRKEGFNGGLTIVGSETHLPYQRPPLSKHVLAGAWSHERTFLRHEHELEALGASWRLGVSAVALDRANRRVELSDGSNVEFDGLVIATGASPRRMGVGHELHGVHVLRTLDDAAAIGAELTAGRRLTIIGAGFLGCEVAAVARKAGMHVDIIDPLPGPMIRQLGQDVAARMAAVHLSNGTKMHLGAGVADFKKRLGHVTGVELTDGSTLDSDLVLVAVGAVPNTQWLAGNGLSLTKGIDCDEFCRAAPGIVAAGDVASWIHPIYRRRVRIEHQTNAIEQGVAAARALLDKAVEPFAPIPYFWTDQYDVKVQVYGIPHAEAATTIVRGDPEDGRFAVAYHHDRRKVAILTWNLPREAVKLRGELVDELQASTS